MNEKADPMLGRVLDGRYRIDRRVARGGMAVVYEATDLRLDRVVAVKVMHEPLADDPTFVNRFEREARSAAKLSHPNAVAVFDQGEDQGTLFLVMEYVPGVTLRDLIRREAPLPPALALRVVESVLSALSAAHAIGIVHRDIKPENVLLATGDITRMDPMRTKVADFGLARAVNAETQHTATGGVIIGTVSYLAPELLVNAASDERVDVYAAGVLLYELLTGKKPHQADNPIQVAYKHVHEDIGKPSAEVRGIPPYLDALVARATTRDVDQRPADAGVLLHHVRRVRHAIDAGVIDDPELTADLLPGTASPNEDTAAEGIAGWDPRSAHDPNADFEETAALGSVVPRPPQTPERRPAQPPVRRTRVRRRRLILLLILLAAILALVFGGGGWYYFAGRYTNVPIVTGPPYRSAQAAIQALKKADLVGKLDPTQEYSNSVPAGDVIRSVPGSGSRVLKNSSVTLVISRGKPGVPRLIGMTLIGAKNALSSVDLTLGKVTHVYNDSYAAGKVVASDPAGGTSLQPGSPVALTISKGKTPVKIPNFAGKTLAQAQTVAGKDKLTIVQGPAAFNESIPKGQIISQTPAPGTQGHHGDTVTVVVSKGPHMLTVPNITGMSWNEAVAAITGTCVNPNQQSTCLKATAANFRAQAYEAILPNTKVNSSSTSPTAGSKVREGTTIGIYF